MHAIPLVATATKSLKRKRSNGSMSPQGRSRSPSPQNEDSRFDMASTAFRPGLLQGDAAAEWRRHVLSDMFRGKAFQQPAADGSQEPPKHLTASGQVPRGRTPAYLQQPLPAFEDPVARRTTLSYLCVGPAIRGKFQPQKATERGVKPGAAFRRLIAGERVWVSTGKTGDGEQSPAKKETKKERAERVKREKIEAEKGASQDGVGEGHWVEPVDCMEQGEDASVSPSRSGWK